MTHSHPCSRPRHEMGDVLDERLEGLELVRRFTPENAGAVRNEAERVENII